MVAKFIPGFASLATALAGRTDVPFGRFLFFDAIGALLFCSAGLALGVIFYDAVDDVLAVLANLGRKPLASTFNIRAAPDICRA